jgi:hypothetical protein
MRKMCGTIYRMSLACRTHLTWLDQLTRPLVYHRRSPQGSPPPHSSPVFHLPNGSHPHRRELRQTQHGILADYRSCQVRRARRRWKHRVLAEGGHSASVCVADGCTQGDLHSSFGSKFASRNESQCYCEEAAVYSAAR